MIPSIINLKIQSGQKFKLRLWIPLFILWPFFILLFLLLLPLILIADFILISRGIKIKLFSMLGGVISVLCAMRGTIIKVDSPKSNAVVHVTIR